MILGIRPLRFPLSLLATLCASLALPAWSADYTLFEAGQVRPLALSDDGQFLYALNTPDDRLEIFRIVDSGLEPVGSVSVGMRPVALAIRQPGEVWVVNHLSDSVSVVDVTPGNRHVKRTLWVGDEPRDIVFAGTDRQRAFITAAHRGQNRPGDPQFTTPGMGRADVWVFEANALGSSAGGRPLAIVTLFADSPRGLAVSPDGKQVYVAAFHSGNQTTAVEQGALPAFTEQNAAGEIQPHTSLIAKFAAGRWTDALGRDVTPLIGFSLPDFDVFTLDASASVPREHPDPRHRFAHVGTTLFNMVVNPRSGALYVSNTEANNATRFEGPGLTPGVNTTVRGNIAQSRITVIRGGRVTPVHLNKHIDYSHCCEAPGNAEARRSLAFPRDMVISRDGSTLYVAAFGSAKIGVFDTRNLESNTFVSRESSQIQLRQGGPSGLALDERRDRLYVLTRFSNSISIVNLRSGATLAEAPMHSPEPASVVAGRPFLYDAARSSSHGDSACASCHVDADMDHLAWDLGDPTAMLPDMPGTAGGLLGVDPVEGTVAFALGLPRCSLVDPAVQPCAPDQSFRFNSHKGPMTTQTLRGMDNHGSMHWRGDRGVGTPSDPGQQPDSGMFDEQAAFLQFNVAFPGLLGRSKPLAAQDMEKFAEFALQLTLPPNPIAKLDHSLTAEQARGKQIYFGGEDGRRPTDTTHTCNGCHTLDPLGNAGFGVERPGFFGTDGRFSFERQPQMLKIPQLRNLYQKVGMFGLAADRSLPFAQNQRFPFKLVEWMGDQVRGFGFQHDGSVDTLFTFLEQDNFDDFGPLHPVLSPPTLPRNTGGFAPFIAPGSFPTDPTELPPDLQYLTLLNDPFFQSTDGEAERADVEAFLLAFPSNLAPIVGQQVTLSRSTGGDAQRRLQLLLERAAVNEPTPECDLIGKGSLAGNEIGYLYEPSSQRFRTSDGDTVSPARLGELWQRSGQELTFTCVPPGSGRRGALDRDGDGFLDGRERRAGSNPGDPASVPHGSVGAELPVSPAAAPSPVAQSDEPPGSRALLARGRSARPLNRAPGRAVGPS